METHKFLEPGLSFHRHIQMQRDMNMMLEGMHPAVGIDIHLGRKDI